MSTVYIIKDGIIVDSMIQYAFYRDPRGVTVKPYTVAEMENLQKLSATNVEIRELEEKIRKLEEDITRFSDLSLAQTCFQEAVQQFEEKYQASKTMTFLIPTGNGDQAVEGNDLNYLTDGGLAAVAEQFNHIRETAGETPEALKAQTMEIMKLNSELSRLTDQAAHNFSVHLWRQKRAKNVDAALKAHGWTVEKIQFPGRGQLLENGTMYVSMTGQNKAVLTFSIEGDVKIVWGTGSEAMREQLWKIVAGALGQKAKGHCTEKEAQELVGGAIGTGNAVSMDAGEAAGEKEQKPIGETGQKQIRI